MTGAALRRSVSTGDVCPPPAGAVAFAREIALDQRQGTYRNADAVEGRLEGQVEMVEGQCCGRFEAWNTGFH